MAQKNRWHQPTPFGFPSHQSFTLQVKPKALPDPVRYPWHLQEAYRCDPSEVEQSQREFIITLGREESYGLSQVTGSFLEIQKGSC